MEIFIVLFFVGFLWLIGKLLRLSPSKGNAFTQFIKDKERKKKELRRKGINPDESPFVKDYPGSPQYQALLKKYNGNIPGSGQGDNSRGKGRNLGERYGNRGGRYNERISKKGNRYRQYY